MIFIFVVLLLCVVITAVWMGLEDRKKRRAREKNVRGAWDPAGAHSAEQAGFLQNIHMPQLPQTWHMPNMHLPFQDPNYQSVPGYGDPAAHMQTHGGRIAGRRF